MCVRSTLLDNSKGYQKSGGRLFCTGEYKPYVSTDIQYIVPRLKNHASMKASEEATDS